jgi:hypothetical protein
MARYSPVRVAELTVWLGILVLVFCSLSTSIGVGAQDREVGSPHGVRFPGGLADTEREVAFIANRDGVDSVDLRSGRRRWTTTSAIAPLTLLENGAQLVAAGFDDGKMFVVMIESSSGKTGKKLELSLGVFATPQTSEIVTQIREPILDLVWKVRSRYRGGANLSPGAEERFHVNAAGEVEIDVKNGVIVKQEKASVENLSGQHDWPNEITERTIGGRVYAITPGDLKENGQQETFLEARERETKQLLWKYPLVSVAKASPRQKP